LINVPMPWIACAMTFTPTTSSLFSGKWSVQLGTFLAHF
jgi:hypothetical protein